LSKKNSAKIYQQQKAYRQNKPLVSVIIPAHNQQRYLSSCLESVVGQTYQQLEIIIIDDLSTDKTTKIIQNWQQKDHRIKAFRNIKNLGATGSRNQGIKHANGKYIAFLDSDDTWHRNKIKLQLAKFNNSRTGLVYCSTRNIDKTGKEIGGDKALWKGDVFLRLIRAMRIVGSNSSVIVRKSLLDRYGHFNPKLPYTGDWELWLRLSSHCQFDYCPQTLTNIRRHANSLGANNHRFILNHLHLFATTPTIIFYHPSLPLYQKAHCLYYLLSNTIDQLQALKHEAQQLLVKKIKTAIS